MYKGKLSLIHLDDLSAYIYDVNDINNPIELMKIPLKLSLQTLDHYVYNEKLYLCISSIDESGF